MSDSLQPHGLQPTGLLCPWDSPGKTTGVGCHSLLQGIFLMRGWTQASCTAGRFFTIWVSGEVLTLDCAADQRWLHLFGTKKWTLSSTMISLGHLTPSDPQIPKLVTSPMVENWNELLKMWRAKVYHGCIFITKICSAWPDGSDAVLHTRQ